MQQGSNIALGIFIAFFFFRYTRTIVSIFTWLTYAPKRIAEKPQFTSKDVTVVIPTTFKTPGELAKCLQSIAACLPAQIFVVTSAANVELVKTCCMLNSLKKVQVLGVEQLNKRDQMLKALQEVDTDIVTFADDDVIWPSHRYLDYLLAIFEDPKVGAGGTRQRVRRNKRNCWNFLGISYLERRVWNNVTTNAIDGSISTLSGRTAAYRTEILKTDEFTTYFTTDSWLGRKLNSDDDKCLTRYVYSHGWDIALQFDPHSVLETTLEEDSNYIHQCIRWARAHWRGNFTVMTNETYWRSSKFWWGLYVIYIGQFQTPALLVDTLQFVLLFRAVQNWCNECQTVAFALLGSWIFFTKVMKMLPHLCRHPEDVVCLPTLLIFSYLHGFISIYSLFTLHVTAWGSQNLSKLEPARAENDKVVPLLRHVHAEVEQFAEPTPGRYPAIAFHFLSLITILQGVRWSEKITFRSDLQPKPSVPVHECSQGFE